jgi:hypothetical protein
MAQSGHQRAVNQLLGPGEFAAMRATPAPMHLGRRNVYACRMSNQFILFLASAVLVVHAGVVLFIVGGLILIVLGGRYRWPWVRNFWFRALHLAAIVYVVAESWLGIVCPLTDLEQWLRARAGQPIHEGDFIAFWLGKLLFYQAEPWVFIAAYSIFALAVVYSWVTVRPRPLKRRIRID